MSHTEPNISSPQLQRKLSLNSNVLQAPEPQNDSFSISLPHEPSMHSVLSRRVRTGSQRNPERQEGEVHERSERERNQKPEPRMKQETSDLIIINKEEAISKLSRIFREYSFYEERPHEYQQNIHQTKILMAEPPSIINSQSNSLSEHERHADEPQHIEHSELHLPSNKEEEDERMPPRKRRRQKPFHFKANKKEKFNIPEIKRQTIKQLHLKRRKAEEKQLQECPVCFAPTPEKDFKIFSLVCNHSFCKGCLKEHIKSQLQLFRQITCLEGSCKEIAKEDSLIYRNELTLEQKIKYYRILIHHNVNRQDHQRLCPKEGCQGYIVTNEIPPTCVICGTQYCLKCMLPRHDNDCDEIGVQFLKENMHFQRCGKCRSVVEKRDGCNHMTCRCGHQFCYLCGGNWGPNHRCNNNSIPLSRIMRRESINIQDDFLEQQIIIRNFPRTPRMNMQQPSGEIFPVIRQNPQRVNIPAGALQRIQPQRENGLPNLRWIFALILYPFIFFPIDFFIILLFLIVALVFFIKDLLVGAFYRGFIIVCSKYASVNCETILLCFLFFPVMAIGIFHELKEGTLKLIPDMISSILFFFILKKICR